MKSILKYISIVALALGIAATPVVAQHHGFHGGGFHGGHVGGHFGGGIHHGYGGHYGGHYGGVGHGYGGHYGGHFGGVGGRGHWRGGVWVPWVAGGYGYGSCYGACIARGYGPAVCSVDPTPYCQ